MVKTFVGVPFYEKEGQRGLDVAVRNIDDRLNELDVDASIIVCVNGEDTSLGRDVGLSIDRSQYNAQVEIIASAEAGQVKAMAELGRIAAQRNIDRFFFTDADIYRFPNSLTAMWGESEDNLVVGAHYRPYPLRIVQEEFGPLSRQEKLLYHVFDGDQTPEARTALRNLGQARKPWVKASLMLVDTATSHSMHDNQVNATDSVMNRLVDSDRITVADEAYFMHMGRVDMTDHIKARLRHFRAAEARGGLEDFLAKEVSLPDDAKMNAIADEIRRTSPRGDYYAMLYLSRCAVRELVNDICMRVITNQLNIFDLPPINPASMKSIKTIEDARQAGTQFLADVRWNDIQGFGVNAPPTTQERLRTPFLLDSYLENENFSQRIFKSLGVTSITAFDVNLSPDYHSALLNKS